MTYSPMQAFLPQPNYEPTTALLLIGTALSATGSIAAGTAAAGEARQGAENDAIAFETQAANDEFNAAVAGQRARAEIDATLAEQADFRITEGGKVATQIADVGGSGLGLSGSKLAITEQGFQDIEFGLARIGAGGSIRATRLEQEASLLTQGAEIRKQSAKDRRKTGKRTAANIRTASFLKAGGQVASGLSSSGISFGGGAAPTPAIRTNASGRIIGRV